MSQVKFAVEGMSCGHCVHHVTEALKGVAGVSAVQVSLEDRSAVVEVGEDFDPASATAAVEEAGYQAHVAG